MVSNENEAVRSKTSKKVINIIMTKEFPMTTLSRLTWILLNPLDIVAANIESTKEIKNGEKKRLKVFSNPARTFRGTCRPNLEKPSNNI